jgi:putative oxidoreductase
MDGPSNPHQKGFAMKIGRLLLRTAVGGFFIGHGTQKLFGWFGGSGIEGTAKGFEALGLRPAKANAVVAGAAEAGGGALMLAGLETPVAAAVLTSTMLTAIKTVHFKNGPWATNGGYEYNVVLIAAALAIAEVGPGALSLDAARGRERHGSGWALAALVGGAIGAVGAHLSAAANRPSSTSASVNGASPEQEMAAEPAAQSA